ncbi:MAG: NAD-dependent epimerase/dehydratase family protein [Nitrospirae bacterium]|nr:MAG: NAD-dependent epimerase/dehydratase family protein [Nitrospirota bacterium]
MKALVTGATGFIGSHLTEALLKKGYSVRCLIRKTSDTKWIESQAVEIVYGDCIDFDSLKEAVSDCDYVFHLAGLTKACREEDYFCVNVKGTENILKAVLSANRQLKRFVLLSSQAASGPSYDGKPISEDTPPRPVSHYGRSKLEAEEVVKRECRDIPYTIIRPSAVYGPRDRDFYMFFKLIKRGIFPYWGNARYSLVYIDDLINGIIQSAESERAIGETYFITDMNEHTNEEIAFLIARTFNKKPTKVRIPWAMMPFLASMGERFSKGRSIFNRDKVRELSYKCWLCDCSKAVRHLGYKPRVELREGIKWTADWYRINRWL